MTYELVHSSVLDANETNRDHLIYFSDFFQILFVLIIMPAYSDAMNDQLAETIEKKLSDRMVSDKR